MPLVRTLDIARPPVIRCARAHFAFTNEERPRMSNEEEIDRVLRAQQGDMDAFRTLVRDHHRRVFHVCLGVVKSTADAEDVTQEVFIRAHQNLSKFQGNAKFSTWL